MSELKKMQEKVSLLEKDNKKMTQEEFEKKYKRIKPEYQIDWLKEMEKKGKI